MESFIRSTNEIKDVHDLVHRVMEIIFEFLKVLDTKSYVTSNGQLVDINKKKSKFVAFFDEATNPAKF